MIQKRTAHNICFVFLLILALPQILIIALQIWQWRIQQEAIERLEKESLQTIIVGKESLQWKNKKEVSIDGRMFDIRSYRIENGRYILTGFFDEKETAIKDFLKKQATSSGPLVKLLLIAQFFVTIVFLIVFPFLFSFKKRVSFFEEYYSFHYKELSSPPPKPSLALN